MNAAETVTRLLGTCAICTRSIKVRDGVMVHHGFQRPGDGYIVGDCFAVHREPYEVSCEVTKEYRALLQKQLVDQEAWLVTLEAGLVPHFIEVSHYTKMMRQFAVGVTAPYEFERVCESRIRETRFNISGLKSEISRLTKMITDWQPRDVQKVMEEKLTVLAADKAMRAAERQAKRDATAARKAATKAKQEALAAKRAAIKKEFRDQLIAMAAEPETEERNAKALKLFSQLKIGKFVNWLFARELECDDAIIELKLGVRDAKHPDFVRYCIYGQYGN